MQCETIGFDLLENIFYIECFVRLAGIDFKSSPEWGQAQHIRVHGVSQFQCFEFDAGYNG